MNNNKKATHSKVQLRQNKIIRANLKNWDKICRKEKINLQKKSQY
jgi:hypothetical protein